MSVTSIIRDNTARDSELRDSRDALLDKVAAIDNAAVIDSGINASVSSSSQAESSASSQYRTASAGEEPFQSDADLIDAQDDAPLPQTTGSRLKWTAPPWLPWLLFRLTSGTATVLVLSAIVFFATQALPSDPARVILGADAPEESIHTLQRQLGLDRPITEQYLTWLGKTVRGDFGVSLDSNIPVTEMIATRMGYSMVILVTVIVSTVPIALSLGILLALRRDSSLDRVSLVSLIVFKAVPGFVIGIILIMIFATGIFQILPAVSLIDPDVPIYRQTHFLILPTLALVLNSLPYLVRLVRTSMIEVLESEYVTQARLRGLPESRILWRHALPNALIPAVYAIAMMLNMLFGGAVLVEVVFTYPGIGSALNSAVEVRDLPMIQAVVLIATAGVVVINLTADLLVVLLTPRLRTAHRPQLINRGLRKRRQSTWNEFRKLLRLSPRTGAQGRQKV